MNHKSHSAKKIQPIKIFLLALLAVIVILLLHCFIRLVQFYHDTNSAPDTDITHYLTCHKEHWVAETPYLLFPDESVVKQTPDVYYLHKHERSPTFLFNDDIVTALHCTYSEETYNAEVERLNMICDPEEDSEGNTVYILMYDPGEGVTAYARLNQETHDIWYVTYQENVLIERWPGLQLKSDRYQPPSQPVRR